MMKRVGLAVGVVVVVLFLAAAAFLGARLLREPEEADASGGGGDEMVIALAGGDGNPIQLRVHIERAAELLSGPETVGGLFDRREDNSIFVGTGDIEVMVEVDGQTGERQADASFSGPVVEVVVTGETAVYRDETDMSQIEPGAAESGEVTIPQVITAVDSLDEIGDNTEIQAWGERRGDRVIADVLVYKPLN
jgi:hypothetical protein